jgi:cell wall-associated NlpC family hydrolase
MCGETHRYPWAICRAPTDQMQYWSRGVDTELVIHTLPACARARVLPMVILAAAGLLADCAIAPEQTMAANLAASWDSAQQHQVVAADLMYESDGSFDGANQLSAAQANTAMVALATRLRSATSDQGASTQQAATGEQGASSEQATPEEQGASSGQATPEEQGASSGQATPEEQGASGEQVTPGEQPASSEQPDLSEGNVADEPDATGTFLAPVAHTAQSPVTVVVFDRMLVEELGLADVAAHVQAAAATVGLRPPAYFGSEVVARFLELRYEHPVGSQRLDLFPDEPITRAEAAWSLARVIDLGDWGISNARTVLSAFELPQMTAAQRQALQIAVSRIGYPYVWGGTTDNTADGLEHGGFDCSGFAWRVYKVSKLPWGREIQGRTAAEQAGEIPKSQRLRVSQLEPGDLLFFGSAHFNSKATERNIVHEGIYLGDNWVIHSSGQGVYVLPLSGSWLGDSFAWGRRVIH